MHCWYQKKPTPLAQALQPLAWLYGTAAHAHGAWRARHAHYAGVPVISVGNLVVGGAGKTPLTQLLAQHFAQAGHQVAIASRGYGGTTTQPLAVLPRTHTAREVGDEPLMLARAMAHLPVQVWVGRHRPSVVTRAEQAGATLIILDDGFQRRDVARTADILVIDGPTAFGNGLTLPAGPLREFLAARTRAHFAVVINEPAAATNTFYGLTTYRLQSSLSHAHLPAGPLVAFAGIANPSKFFTALRHTGAKLAETIPFPDHHRYTAQDLKTLTATTQAHNATLVTTSKDATKLPHGFAHPLPLHLHGPDLPQLLTHLHHLLT